MDEQPTELIGVFATSGVARSNDQNLWMGLGELA